MIAELLLSMSAIITGSTFDGFPHQSPSIKIDGHKGSYNHDNCFPWEWKRNQGSYRYTLHAVHIWEHEYAHAKGYHPYEKEADSVHEIYAHGWQKSSGFLPITGSNPLKQETAIPFGPLPPHSFRAHKEYHLSGH